MSNVITSAKHKGYELKIFYGYDSIDPRKHNVNLGKMMCYNSRYTLGDTEYRDENFETRESCMDIILYSNEILGYLPLYLYDHSGISISWTKETGWNAFDTSLLGFYIFTKQDVLNYDPSCKGLSDESLKEIGLSVAKKEIREYDKYISGALCVIDYIFEDPEGKVIDSYAGFNIGENELNEDSISEIMRELSFDDDSIDIESFKKEMARKLLENIDLL
jgi:hypothetical protein